MIKKTDFYKGWKSSDNQKVFNGRESLVRLYKVRRTLKDILWKKDLSSVFHKKMISEMSSMGRKNLITLLWTEDYREVFPEKCQWSLDGMKVLKV